MGKPKRLILAASKAKEATENTESSTMTVSEELVEAIAESPSFSTLKGHVSQTTLDAVAKMGFTEMTKIQAKCIPSLLSGFDLLGAAKTGSGKTLAFLIPAIELVAKLDFQPHNGTGVIIISPTRELAIQIFGILKELMACHPYTYALLTGGTNRGEDVKRLSQGMNIIVATPGRLLDHLKNTPTFLYKNLQCLVIDEADRILDVGFEETMKDIVKALPKKRQSVLFSATTSKRTQDLSKLALKKEPVYVGVDDEENEATVEGLTQGFVICPSEKRLHLLFTFLKKNYKKKIMVFFSSCSSVEFHSNLFNQIDLSVQSIHGQMKQTKRTKIFFDFCNAEQGILLCTDVAARGWDIPAVDWIVQYDPPDDPKDYIHRVGRTARAGGSGQALLILGQSEAEFLEHLKKAKVTPKQFEFDWSKIKDIQLGLEKLISTNYLLNKSAKEGFKAYVRAYKSHALQDVYSVKALDMKNVALSFGLKVPPTVEVDFKRKKETGRKRRIPGDVNRPSRPKKRMRQN